MLVYKNVGQGRAYFPSSGPEYLLHKAVAGAFLSVAHRSLLIEVNGRVE